MGGYAEEENLGLTRLVVAWAPCDLGVGLVSNNRRAYLYRHAQNVYYLVPHDARTALLDGP